MTSKDETAEQVRSWAQHALADELVLVREATTVGRRAYHEGVAAALSVTAGDHVKSAARVTQILADYTGVRNVEGRRGYSAGVLMTRGVMSYLDVQGKLNVAEWQADADAAVVDA